MTILSLLILGFVLHTLRGMRSELQGLTAVSAWRWAVFAVSSVIVVTFLNLFPVVPPGITSALQYLSATLLLTPLVDILGARNPGHRAWPWFVVLPMIVVLQWPVLSHVISEQSGTPVEVPSPTMVGFLLVLVMGAGNYFGTTHTAAALIGAVGVIASVLPVTEWFGWPTPICSLTAAICLAVAALLVEGRLRTQQAGPAHQRLWNDFRDIYGLVWARRVMDRVNQFAEREQWEVVMTLNGFQAAAKAPPETQPTERPIEILRWVIRRFADDEFVSRYHDAVEPSDASRDNDGE